MAFVPRPKQAEVLAYRQGRMGVSAVPGSGKTTTLSYLAAQLVAQTDLDDDQEILVVTLVRSAVDHFAARVADFVSEAGLLPNLGYRVCTLHSLALEIVRERPDLVGLSEDFIILEESEGDALLRDATAARLRLDPDLAHAYLAPGLSAGSRSNVLSKGWPETVFRAASAFIRRSKDLGHTPETLRAFLGSRPTEPILGAALDIYADYQRALAYRGALDFDDLIRLSLQALHTDADLLARLRHRWPYVLEDEAQDSSRLQEEVLRLLVGPDGNWVRVGDPNQAIFETFTTADPRFLRRFLEEPGVVRRELPNSGRSTESIISLANRLIDWTNHEHPAPAVRDALSPPHILPAPPGDAQPNPPDRPDRIHFAALPGPQGGAQNTATAELQRIIPSIRKFLAERPDGTIAVLVPRNRRGSDVVRRLNEEGIPYIELLKNRSASREVAQRLHAVLSYLADPLKPNLLRAAYLAWVTPAEGEEVLQPPRLPDCLEDLLYPVLSPTDSSPDDLTWQAFIDTARRWLSALDLPIDQLMLTVGQDLFSASADLNTTHRLSVYLGGLSRDRPEWRLPQFNAEIHSIARGNTTAFSLDDSAPIDPSQHRGVVVVSTMHKAKGLEWDRVYLVSMSTYDFPSGMSYDRYMSSPDYVRDGLDLQAEVLAQLESLTQPDTPYVEGVATADSQAAYSAERLRLLYVGITRARQELVLSWNSGQTGREQPSIPYTVLKTWWEANHAPSA